MQDTTKTIDIIAISFDRNSGEFIFSVNFYLLSVIFLLLLIFFMVFRSWLKKNYSIKETEFELTAAFTKTKFKVQRNTENLKSVLGNFDVMKKRPSVYLVVNQNNEICSRNSSRLPMANGKL